MKISVFGLGYVGVVNVACLSNFGHKLVGIDIKESKVSSINNGLSPIYEARVEELLKSGVASGLVSAVISPNEAIAKSDVAIICVGTPSRDDGSVDLSYTINSTLDIIKELSENPKEFTIVYRSTIPPGTIEKDIVPLINQLEGRISDLIKVVFIPEFLREGSAVSDFLNAPRIVVGRENSSVDNIIQEIFNPSGSIEMFYTTFKTAEFVKYVDNAFHAVKVTFANEIYSLGASYGIDIKKANEIFLNDRDLNISTKYLKPGMPFGGSCLPKDLRSITAQSTSQGLLMPFINNMLASNTSHLERIKKIIENTLEKNKLTSLLFCGLSFKAGTDDIRESPILKLVEYFIEQEIDLQILDSEINHTELRISQPRIARYFKEDVNIKKDTLTCIFKNEIIDGSNMPNSIDFVNRESKYFFMNFQ